MEESVRNGAEVLFSDNPDRAEHDTANKNIASNGMSVKAVSAGDDNLEATERGGFSADLESGLLLGIPDMCVSKDTGTETKDIPRSLREMINTAFPGKRQDIRSYSALTLAYIGDVVYDLIIRTIVVGKGNRPVNDLHRLTVKYVSAPAQAKMIQAVYDFLTEEEQTVFRRGKNTKPHTTAKNARVSDYLKATGFEAVIGYLYLTDNMERALELVKKGITLAGLEI